MKRAAFRLHPGEKVMQPGILLHFREGKNIREGKNEFRRFMIAHHAPRNSRGELFKPPLALALWGGLETDKQLQRLKAAQEKQLPYEELWIDAGWMGSPGPCPHFLEDSQCTSDWPRRVGSWDFNTYAHPQGLRPIADAAHRAGMRLMVWFESLRIASASGARVIKEHPEWLLGDWKGFTEGKEVDFLLNIGIQEARKYLFDTISGIIEREGIDDYREDFNLSPQTHFASGDEPDRIGITEMKFVEACYLFWEDLRKRFPDLFIDNCASGGRKLDYKTASMSFPLCQSDFATFQDYEEECVQLENLYLDDWLPLHGTLNWGPEDPYHAASGLGCGFGCKVWQFNGRDPKPDHDYDFHRKILQWGKQLRDLHLTGDVYPLVEAPEDDWAKWNGQQIHDPKENCGMIQIFRRKKSPDPDFQLKLNGLDPSAVYETEFFTGEKRKLSGRELVSLVIHLDSPRSFQIIQYKKTG
jgi:alpha-galactosidase